MKCRIISLQDRVQTSEPGQLSWSSINCGVISGKFLLWVLIICTTYPGFTHRRVDARSTKPSPTKTRYLLANMKPGGKITLQSQLGSNYGQQSRSFKIYCPTLHFQKPFQWQKTQHLKLFHFIMSYEAVCRNSISITCIFHFKKLNWPIS